MVYSIGKENEMSWYVSFRKDREWQVNKMQNISRQELSGLMKLSDTTDGI